jgi:hypothetical protein
MIRAYDVVITIMHPKGAGAEVLGWQDRVGAIYHHLLPMSRKA